MRGETTMIIGVQTYTVRDYLENKEQFIETLRKIKQIGYDCVQIGTPPFMTDEELINLTNEIGLEICSAYAEYEELLSDPAAINEAIKLAKLFNTDMIDIGTLPDVLRDKREGFEEFAKGMNKIGKDLNKEGCKLSYHNHALEFYSFGGGISGMDILLNETDPSCVCFTLDTHWLASGGVNPVDWIYKAEGRMPLIHFKDYAIGESSKLIEGVNKLFAEVGEGNLDWPKIIEACHKTGVKYAVVEQDFCKGNPFDSLETSYKNILKFNA